MTASRTIHCLAGGSRAALALAALLGGCAIVPPQAVSSRGGDCREVFARVDEAVVAAGVADGLAARVAGFPYLRADRFLASYAREALEPAAHAEWVSRMRAMGSAANAIEIANLPRGAVDAAAVERCSAELAAADLADPRRREPLKNSVAVPDDYSTPKRVAGLYWLTRIPFAAGIRRWHEEVRDTFATPLAALPVAGEVKRYAPPGTRRPAAEIAAIIARASANALRIPAPAGADLDALFETFAPIYAVDTAGVADMPGPLAWGEATGLAVQAGAPVVYHRVSYARHEGRVLLQLNYWLWFPERPRRGAWDILGGRLDGLLWRVTLSPQGTPMVFDAIHPCGCYHLFFPAPRASAKPQPESLDEPAFVPQALPAIEAGQRLELWLESSTHYLRRVVVGGMPGAGTPYSFAEDDTLRSLPLPGGGRRSAFRPDGIVAGSERGERWLFWPMGIAEPGAMRQWGRHATAFVGRRHFDDPGLLSRYFDLVIIP